MKLFPSVFYLFLLGLLASCGGKTQQETSQKTSDKADPAKEAAAKAQTFFAALPTSADNPDNPMTEEKALLGQILYYDTRLSKDGNQSCNTCHNLATYGVDHQPTSQGDDQKSFGDRNSPTTLNAALHFAQFWDGRAKDVEEQAGMPILNPVEMNIPSKEFLEERLAQVAAYKEMFAKAFPDDEKPISYDNIQKALGAFERTLITPSRFDDYLGGKEDALSQEEIKGILTFMDAGCTSCHNGALLGGTLYQKFGLFGDYWEHTKSEKIDEGCYAVTKDESDKYMFKVPSLRNVAETAPYFHDGSVAKLEDAVKIMGKLNAGRDLSDEETQSIVTFLKALTGELNPEAQKAPAELASH